MARYRIRRLQLRASAAVLILLAVLQAPPAISGWREDMKVFRIGMVAEDGAGQTVPGLSMLKRAYTQALGVSVEIFVARDYAALIDAQATSRIDYAVYSATAYATASLLCSCVEPVVAPLGPNGEIGIVAILVARDSRLTNVTEIGSHRVAVAPPESVAASMLPFSALSSEGILPAGVESNFVRAESASAAEAMLVDGSVDAIFGWAPAGSSADVSGGTLDRLAAAGLDEASLAVVWQSPPLRYGPHALRTGLDREVRQILMTFLTGLKDLQPDVYDLLDADHGGGFTEVHLQDYTAAVEMVRRLSGEKPGP